MPERHRRRPAGRAIIADIENAPDRELAPGEADDDVAILIRYPRPYPVQRDDVELRKVVAGRKLGEGLVRDAGAGFRGVRHLLGGGGVAGIEVDAPELSGARRRVDVQGQTLAEAEFEIAQRLVEACVDPLV